MNKIVKMVRKAEVALTKNKAKTLTTVNCVGVIATAAVSMRAGMNIQKKIDDGTFTKPDILKEIAPVIGAVALTEIAGIRSYKTSAKSIADLTLGLNQVKREYDTLEKKVRESVGDEKADEIKKEALKEAAKEKADISQDITGCFWYKDDFTGAYFYTTEKALYKAWNKVSKRLYVGEVATVNDFYYELERKDQLNESWSLTMHFGWDGSIDSYNRNCDICIMGADTMPNGVPCKKFGYTCKPAVFNNRKY